MRQVPDSPPAEEAASIELNGQPPTPAQLAALALDSYGHFTAMQVRNGSVRGLAFHLARLSAAQRQLFGQDLDPAAIRDYIRHALGTWQAADASVRVYVRRAAEHDPLVMVTVRPPGDMPQHPWRLTSVPYMRAEPEIKHLGDFGQTFYQHQVQAGGADEALLTSPDGAVCEGSITNVGFYDGTRVSWPDAPVLAGITMQVLRTRLAAAGLTDTRRKVTVAGLGSFTAAFVTNARGIAPVGAIDDHVFQVDQDLMARLTGAYDSAPWDAI